MSKPQTVKGIDLELGDVVQNWESATILQIQKEPAPSVIVCAETDKGLFYCGKEADMAVTYRYSQ